MLESYLSRAVTAAGLIDSDTLDKLHYVADYEGRSANSQVRILIRDCIEKFEREHGKIFDDKK